MNNSEGWSGPLESGNTPTQLLARVITPGRHPRLHGYDVEADLAPNYDILEVAFLSITGELPEPDIALALNSVLVFTAAVSVAHAPTHAAVLSQLCGNNPSATLGVAAIALAEQVKHTLIEHKDLLEWLDRPTASCPEQIKTPNPDAIDSLEKLNLALRPSRLAVPGLKHAASVEAAVLMVLHACGLRNAQQLGALLVWARLPAVLAEAFAESEANFKTYPINLPHFEYEEAKQ